jgi:hypothetical protein
MASMIRSPPCTGQRGEKGSRDLQALDGRQSSDQTVASGAIGGIVLVSLLDIQLDLCLESSLPEREGEVKRGGDWALAHLSSSMKTRSSVLSQILSERS